MATLRDLILRFQQAGTTDENMVLTSDELQDPKTKQLANLAKSSVLAKRQSDILAEKNKQEEINKKEKMASAFGLTEEEKAQYLAPPKQPTVSPSLPASLAVTLPMQGSSLLDEGKGKLEQPIPPSPSGGVNLSKDKGTIPPPPSQEEKKEEEKKQATVNDTLAQATDLANRLTANSAVSRKNLDKLVNKLQDIKLDENDVSKPETARFVKDRAAAYELYQQKADRNDWLELAQNLVNSITQYASARAAMGTTTVGGNLPLIGVDYGERSRRAAKEYEMALGRIGEEEAGQKYEFEKSRQEKKEAKKLERENLLEKIQAEKEDIKGKMEVNEDKRRTTISLYNTILQNELANKQADARAATATGKLIATGNRADVKEIDGQIGGLETQLKNYQNQLSAANKLATADKKNRDEALAVYASAYRLPIDEIQKDTGWFGKSLTDVAKAQAVETINSINEMNAQIAQLREKKNQLSSFPGETGQPSQPSPPSLPPPTSGMVDMVAPDGRALKVPADKVAELEAKGARRK